jgi:hypothetical protein
MKNPAELSEATDVTEGGVSPLAHQKAKTELILGF